METNLTHLSNELAQLVEDSGAYIVSILGRRHYPSSGLLWGDGVIVTANHTVQRDDDISVVLGDDTTATAKLVGRDLGSDVAVLRIDGRRPSAEGRISKDAPRPGEYALVIGRSPDSGVNASLGIVSAVSGPWRTWSGGQLEAYIRLDARLFPQSSGGAVVNGTGQIIGMATSALSRIAGVAIPASTISRVTAKILERGFLPRGYLGIGVQPVRLPEELRQKLTTSQKSGLIVLTVESDGPAAKAGIGIGDIVVAANETTIEDIEDLQRFSESAAIGSTATIKLIRGGLSTATTVIIAERPRKES